jgi:chemotaxis protein MotB
MKPQVDALKERVKSIWLLSFGDVTTLLITFFIMMLALNYGAISRVQKWVDDELTHAYWQLKQAVEEGGLDLIEVRRDTRGVLIRIHASEGFAPARVEPTPALRWQLMEIGRQLRYLRLFNEHQTPTGRYLIARARQKGIRFQPEISVEGHTDSDPVAPNSPVRNNWILSALRAETVMAYLVRASAMDPALFSVTGYGDTRPLVPNDTPEHKAMNRRVEIVLTAAFVKMAENRPETAKK